MAKSKAVEEASVVNSETVQEVPKTENKKFATESFNLDHTKVHAPYVRLASKKVGEKGDVVSKFDIRFCQPNVECMTTGEIHTLEHIMSEIIHSNKPEVIDFSPMGCRSGFYLTMFGEPTEESIAQFIMQVLLKVAVWNREIPGATEQTCGNYKDQDLVGARKRAKEWVGGIMAKGYGM